jgi:photosystem II stability/assembly factor-like uncharacterized protein
VTSADLFIGTVGMSTWTSDDLGETLSRHWSSTGLYSESRVWSLAAHPKAPPEILAGTDSGVYAFDRSTSKWTHLPSDMDSLTIWSIVHSPDNPDIVLAGTRPSAIFRSEDRGRTWTRSQGAFAPTCPAVGKPRVTQIVFDPQDPQFVCASIEIDGIWRSRDGGKSFERCAEGMVSEDGHGISIVRRNGARILYATTNQGLHVSHDDGASWTLRPVQTPWRYMRGIAPRPDNSGVMFVGHGDNVPGSTGMLLRSRDFGETWEDAKLPGELDSTVWCIGTNAADPNLIFVSTCFGKYFRSTDGGETFVKLPRELGETRALLWLPR